MLEKHQPQSTPLSDLRSSPMLHGSLTLEQQRLARRTYESCGHFYYSTCERWELTFLQDADVNRELFLWYAIAQSFERLRPLYPEREQRRLLGQIVRCAAGSTPIKYPEITDIYASVCGEITARRDADDDNYFHLPLLESNALSVT
jgi:hypothetical protein